MTSCGGSQQRSSDSTATSRKRSASRKPSWPRKNGGLAISSTLLEKAAAVVPSRRPWSTRSTRSKRSRKNWRASSAVGRRCFKLRHSSGSRSASPSCKRSFSALRIDRGCSCGTCWPASPGPHTRRNRPSILHRAHVAQYARPARRAATQWRVIGGRFEFFTMVGARGLEPRTSSVSRKRSLRKPLRCKARRMAANGSLMFSGEPQRRGSPLRQDT